MTEDKFSYKKNYSRSIHYRFIVLMAILVSSMLCIFGYITYKENQSQKNSELQIYLESIKKRLSQSLPSVIWRFDQEQIKQIIDAEFGSKSIKNIYLYDEKKRLIYSTSKRNQYKDNWNNPEYLSKDDFIYSFPLTVKVDDHAEEVGFATLHATSAEIKKSLSKEAMNLLLLVLLINFVMITALSILIRMVVINPLNSVGDALVKIAEDGADLSMRMPNSQWKEFDRVIQSFNAFVNRLDSILGAPIDEVHYSINRISKGDFRERVQYSANATSSSVIVRLGQMQNGLMQLTDELKSATEKAKYASQAKSDFLANMSHEIRTPLNAILGLTRILLQSGLGEESKKQLRKVLFSAEHLLGLINDILDFSKIEAGMLDLEYVHFNLDDVIQKIIALFEDKIADKKLGFIIDVDEELSWDYLGDPLRLSQIIINFTNNAIKFTDDGEILIYFKKISEKNNSCRLKIGVIDTGIGIPEEKQKLLFKNFVQVDASTSRKYGGTGLGLSISKKLAELMGGEVGISSKVGMGSEFWCEIIIDKFKQNSQELLNSEILDGKKAIICMDNAKEAKVLSKIINRLGGEPVFWSDDLSKNCVDFLFIDCSHKNYTFISKLNKFEKIFLFLESNSNYLVGDADNIFDIKKPIYRTNVLNAIKKSKEDARNSEFYINSYGEKNNLQIKKKVLLVEDIELNREVAIGLIEMLGLGIDVEVAANGNEAVEKIKNNNYSAVFMDVHMPVMDGIMATKIIKANAENFALPVIAMTANSLDSELELCFDAGMCDSVSKPIDPENLKRVILKWLSEKTTAADNKKIIEEGLESSSNITTIDFEVYIERMLKALEQGRLEEVSKNCNELMQLSGENNFTQINQSVKRIEQLIQQLAFPNEIYEQIQVLSADIRKSRATFSL